MNQSGSKAQLFKEYANISEQQLLIAKKDIDLVIVAAGKGTRLGYSLPKLLYPVMGRTILERILESFADSFSKLIVVVSSAGKQAIEEFITKTYPSISFELVIQSEPLGMADAVFTAVPALEASNTMIVWGDQASIARNTVLKAVMAMVDLKGREGFILLTRVIKDPYIHFVRNTFGEIQKVLQRREDDVMPEQGETDCGFFIFSKSLLKKISTHKAVGERTKEYNFLPLLAEANRMATSVTLQVVSSVELMGVNTKEDAKAIEESVKNDG